jgi:two-component system sensor histidine kinase PilS (NtrC family)
VAPEGARLLGMIRNNTKRIDRIVGEILALNRRDRQQPEPIELREFLAAMTEEIMQAEKMPPGAITLHVPAELTISFDRGHLNQITRNHIRNAWQH